MRQEESAFFAVRQSSPHAVFRSLIPSLPVPLWCAPSGRRLLACSSPRCVSRTIRRAIARRSVAEIEQSSNPIHGITALPFLLQSNLIHLPRPLRSSLVHLPMLIIYAHRLISLLLLRAAHLGGGTGYASTGLQPQPSWSISQPHAPQNERATCFVCSAIALPSVACR